MNTDDNGTFKECLETKITPDEARAQGFIVDSTCYPWVAYKGERFRTHEWRYIFTDTEADLISLVTRMLDTPQNVQGPLYREAADYLHSIGRRP